MNRSWRAANGFLPREIRLLPRRDRLALLALFAIVALLLEGALFRGQVFYNRDIHLVWHPQAEAFVRAVASGSWPVWDPCLGFGQPLLAESAAQVLYPLTWLNLLVRPWVYYTIFVLFHVIVSGVGMYLLSRRWRFSAGTSLLVASIWILSGPFVSLFDLRHHFASAAWLPWAFLAAEGAFARPRAPQVLGLG